ncbi:MAG TPA: prepilin-type N-terminal cleavage/methylation domain-containing protein, partial [Phycisphaerae bacterium]|nr:prepilin-type N-terminal cleavage/methylation domain-containing protein [Phycisphaerae bacterium]
MTDCKIHFRPFAITRPSLARSFEWRRKAFTLIELLVAVSIIALLVAILIPALQAARNQVQAAHCANNMRQGVNGAIVQLLEAGMRKERWSTNYGWAVQSLRINKCQTEIFN